MLFLKAAVNLSQAPHEGLAPPRSSLAAGRSSMDSHVHNNTRLANAHTYILVLVACGDLGKQVRAVLVQVRSVQSACRPQQLWQPCAFLNGVVLSDACFASQQRKGLSRLHLQLNGNCHQLRRVECHTAATDS
eukprot:scaffold160399_cov20-Tisochrysis_lutea.AAC.2